MYTYKKSIAQPVIDQQFEGIYRVLADHGYDEAQHNIGSV